MRKILRGVFGALLLTGVLLAGTATAASATPPERETVTFSVTFHDEFLSEACRVDVTTTETGRVTFLTFPGSTSRPS